MNPEKKRPRSRRTTNHTEAPEQSHSENITVWECRQCGTQYTDYRIAAALEQEKHLGRNVIEHLLLESEESIKEATGIDL